MSTESVTGHRRTHNSGPDPQRGWDNLMAQQACHLPLQQGVPRRGAPLPCCLGPQHCSLCPPPFPPVEGGSERAGHWDRAGAGRAPVGGSGAGKSLVTAALRTSLVWGYGAHREERWTGGGPWGPGLPTGRLSEGRVPRRWIRSLWTQCARGGRGSRLSSPRRVAGWACWRPPLPRARATAAPAAGCAGTSPRSSAAAASGTR